MYPVMQVKRFVNKPLVLFLLVAWACIIRFVPMLVQLHAHGQLTSYHSGGLFYAIVDAISENRFVPPARIEHYTSGGLPFAYPPLAFYLVALVAVIGFDTPGLILVVNMMLSCVSVVAFASFAYKVNMTALGRTVAIIAFATMPQTFATHLPGEGLAESLGTLCFIIWLNILLGYSNAMTWRRSWWCGVLLAANVLAAPGTAYAAPVVFIGFMVYLIAMRRNQIRIREFLEHTIFTIACSLFIAAPYLLHVLRTYGLFFLSNAFQNEQSLNSTLRTVAGTLLPDLNAPLLIWHYLAIVGLVYTLQRKMYGWSVLTLFLASIPREGDWLITLPLAFLAAFGIELLSFICSQIQHDYRLLPGVKRGITWAGALVACYAAIGIPIVVLATAYTKNTLDYNPYVTSAEAAYLHRLDATAPQNATLLVIGNEIEWVPLLANRTVVNVLYGTEWKPDKLRALIKLNLGIVRAENATQLYQTILETHRQHPATIPMPDLVYISKYNEFRRGLEPAIDSTLLASIQSSSCFTLVEDTVGAVVFAPVHCVIE